MMAQIILISGSILLSYIEYDCLGITFQDSLKDSLSLNDATIVVQKKTNHWILLSAGIINFKVEEFTKVINNHFRAEECAPYYALFSSRNQLIIAFPLKVFDFASGNSPFRKTWDECEWDGVVSEDTQPSGRSPHVCIPWNFPSDNRRHVQSWKRIGFFIFMPGIRAKSFSFSVVIWVIPFSFIVSAISESKKGALNALDVSRAAFTVK